MLKGTLQQMATWIHTYIANQDGLECVNSDVRIHSVFYSVCQSLFYVVAFRQKDLFNNRKSKFKSLHEFYIAFLYSYCRYKFSGNIKSRKNCCKSTKSFTCLSRGSSSKFCSSYKKISNSILLFNNGT